MSKGNSHANCDHPATKAARARCRRTNVMPSLRKFAEDQLGWDINTLRLTEDNAAELRETIAQATGLDYPTRMKLEQEVDQYTIPRTIMSNTDVLNYDRLQRELAEYDQNPGQMPETVTRTEAGKLELAEQIVTRENWREFRHEVVEIEITTHGATGNHKRLGMITAWGAKYMTYAVPKHGTSTRVPTERVMRATRKK